MCSSSWKAYQDGQDSAIAAVIVITSLRYRLPYPTEDVAQFRTSEEVRHSISRRKHWWCLVFKVVSEPAACLSCQCSQLELESLQLKHPLGVTFHQFDKISSPASVQRKEKAFGMCMYIQSLLTIIFSNHHITSNQIPIHLAFDTINGTSIRYYFYHRHQPAYQRFEPLFMSMYNCLVFWCAFNYHPHKQVWVAGLAGLSGCQDFRGRLSAGYHRSVIFTIMMLVHASAKIEKQIVDIDNARRSIEYIAKAHI